ncbi:nitrate- and nitrite sensing domain-containing protein [Micromonospora sp. NPDC000207]|uniref:nitrate- and nitrite sensing domain-containing protein n=1 Tax=Micromonospora sp. NPDC000207 TaxID=3154246 RepID=UPI00331754A8
MSTGPTTMPDAGDGKLETVRRRLPRLRDARIRSKLALILVVPVAAVIALATIRLIATGEGAVEATRIRALTALSVDVSALTQDLHRERMAAAAYLATPGQSADDYNLRVRRTDERIADYREERARVGAVPTSVDNRLDVIDNHLDTLSGTRQGVLDRRQMPVAAAALRYGVVLGDLVSYGDVLAQLSGDDRLAENRRAVAAFSRAKGAVAEQEAVAFTALVGGRLDEEQFSSFVATLTGQQEALLSFSLAADPAQRALVDSTVSGDAVGLADKIASDITRSVGQSALVTKEEAANSIGAVNDLMRWAEVRLQDELLADAEQARSEVIRQAIVEAILVLLTLIIAVTLAVMLARSLNQSLRRLREGALSVANHDLPEAVSRLQNINNVGDGGVEEIVRQVRDPIKLNTRDEVGQVALAFNVVHQEAVRVAAEQAALRTSVSAMFLNLARRSQTLVDRMIGELDAIERSEEDPKRLARLFELDHLATRMRRNDENLLVLAGADSAVPRRDDALLVDVLRAAQSEVEQYNRIEFGTVDTDVSVAAHAVNDVVRLVAELLDNATRFSAPNTTVVADGRRIRDYVLIQIEDRGLGLSDEQLDSLNRRLAAPPTVDVAAFRLMGLAVVSRLASRYQIRVELRRNVEGGTVAQVTLPAAAVVLPSQRGREQIESRPRQPEPTPLTPASVNGDAPAGAGRSSAATMTEQWRTGTPTPTPPASWQTPVDARTSAPPVRAGGSPLTTPEPAPADPAVRNGGLPAMGGPTVAIPALDPLPRRAPVDEPTRPATPVLPAGPTAGLPAATPAPTPLPAAPAPNTPAANPAAAAPVTGRRNQPAEAPIFREMEAVWFRSHGNDETAIFTRPSFDQPPTTSTPTPTPAAPAAPSRPPLPTRTPGAVATPPPAPAPAQTPPPSYTPPAASAPPAVPTAPAEPAPSSLPPVSAPSSAEPEAWQTAADDGWTRASRAAEPTNSGTTRSGLPKRVPQAQLVPGGIENKSGRDRSRRTPDEVRGLLSAYHRGVQRGRTAGADQNSTSTKETSR